MLCLLLGDCTPGRNGQEAGHTKHTIKSIKTHIIARTVTKISDTRINKWMYTKAKEDTSTESSQEIRSSLF